MYIEKKIITIIILSITASLLALATFSNPAARADVVNGANRDYQVVTCHGTSGSDDLYILDNRTGLLAIFMFDQSRKGVVPRQFTSVPKLFGNAR